MEGDIDKLRGVGAAQHGAIAIKIGAYAHVIDAHHLDGVLQMLQGMQQSSLAILSQEAVVKCDLHNPSLVSKGAHLVVSEIARHVTESSTITVRTHYRHTTDIQRVIERPLTTMTQVDHYTLVVHFVDDLLTKLGHTIVRVTSTGAVANIVIAIVTQCDIHHASLGEVAHIGNVVIESKPILYAHHDALAPLSLVLVKVGRRAGNADILAVLVHDTLYLVKDQVGILCWREARGKVFQVGIVLDNASNIHRLREFLAHFWLRKIGHHDDGVLPAIGHLVQVVKHTWVAMAKLNALWEKHRGVAMAVEGEYASVKLLGRKEIAGVRHQPPKYL